MKFDSIHFAFYSLSKRRSRCVSMKFETESNSMYSLPTKKQLCSTSRCGLAVGIDVAVADSVLSTVRSVPRPVGMDGWMDEFGLD